MLANKRVTGSASRSHVAARSCEARAAALGSRVAFASWSTTRHECALAPAVAQSSTAIATGAPVRKATTMMGNKGSGGIFSPLVVVTRNIVGEKEFNKLRGKAISLHSQVIKDFCKQLGVDNKQVQGVIRLAKKNGEWLGFLA